MKGNEITHGFLLAAGYGKRMGEYTQNTPKPLLRVENVPLIVFSLYFFKKLGIENIVVNAHYFSDHIETFLKKAPFNITVSIEKEILGTAGGIKKVIFEKKIPEDKNFFLLNTDMILEPLIINDLPTLPDDNLSFLFLKEKQGGNLETGWDIKEKNKLKLNQINGNYFYIGFSILHPELFLNLENDRPEELGTLWKDLSSQDKLYGSTFKPNMISCGNENDYNNVKKQIPIFLSSDIEFMDFASQFFN